MKQVLFILLVFISFQGFSQNVKMNISYNIEVMTTDLGEMTWDNAKKACEKLGDGWRLPTIQELRFMFDKFDEIAGFEPKAYWSSTESGLISTWTFSFYTGGSSKDSLKDDKYSVRAVRDVK
jgi:hypothetical protein